MRTVDISVRHDNDAVVAELVGIKLVFSDAAAKRRYQRTHFGRAQHFVKTRLLHIEYLAFKRKNRLKLSITPLLRRPPCGVALNEIQLAQGGIPLLAICQLARQTGNIEGAFAPRHFARLARSFSRSGCVNHLSDDLLGVVGVLKQEVVEKLVHCLLNRSLDLTGNQLVFGLG